MSNSKNHDDQLKTSLTKEDILNAIDNFTQEKAVGTAETSSSDRGSDSSPTTDTNGCTDGSSTSTSVSNSYCTEWESLFMKPNYLTSLKRLSVDSGLRSCRFRSIAWRLFLEVLPESVEEWVTYTNNSRKKYSEIKESVIVNPRHQDEDDLHLNNPLSQHDESPWNQFFQDNELKVTIKQDVIRTFPELQFFHTDGIHDLMSNILFCYARTNERLCYKQGMHELLAPLIFILHCDHQAFLHALEMESVGTIIQEILNPDYLEHDAYALFCQVMDTVELWYVSKEFYPRKHQPATTSIAHIQPFSRTDQLNPSNAIVTKLTRIQDYILKKYDCELYMHLERLDIAPQIYGIRWVRLLFGRELPMQDLLAVWDAIFADTISFDLVDYLFVSMLMYIRDVLLSSDYPTCLHILMRYPPVCDVNNIIQRALYLREPNAYPKPPLYTFKRKLPEWGIVGMKKAEDKANKSEKTEKYKPNPVISGLATLTRRIKVSPSRDTATDSQMSKSTSEPMNLVTDKSPDEVPTSRKGSTASEPGFEVATRPAAFKPTLSANSIARMDTSRDKLKILESLRSSGDYKYATMPSRKSKHKKGSNELRHAQTETSALQGKLNDISTMHQYCATKLDVHIDKLQTVALRQIVENEDEILLALAGLKQVRDILKGTLKFSHNLLDDDEIQISEDHYKDPQSHDLRLANEKRMFYVSSAEPSECSPMSEHMSDGELANKLPTPPEELDLGKVNTLTDMCDVTPGDTMS